ncbi:unnamed protein product, partial [Closterium sp. NIES-53]
GRPVQFDTWLDNLQLYLLSDSKDSVSLFDLASGAVTAPPATAESLTHSQWLTRDAAARLAIRNHLPLAECAHFGKHRTAQAPYDAVVARYSFPAIAALGRLLLPYLFPELSAFATIRDLVSHLRASDARYRAAVLAEFIDKNPPPMYITLYFIVTRLPDSLRSVRDHFLSLELTSLTVDLLEQHLLAGETSVVALLLQTSLFLRTSELLLLVRSAAAARVRVAGVVEVAAVVVEVVAGVVVGAEVEVVAAVGQLAGVGALVAVVEAAVGVAAVEAVGLALGESVLGVASVSSSSVGARPRLPSSFVSGFCVGRLEHRCFSRLDDAWRAEFGDDVELPCWADLLKSRIAIFDLDFDAILSALYALSVSAEGECYQCVPPDPGIAAAALGASESGTLPSTAPAEALHTFTLDSGASRCFFRDSTTLTPLLAPSLVRLADPSGGLVVARSSTVLPCPAVSSGSLSGLHLPSFSTSLRVSICTCTWTGRHLATFTCRPGSSVYTLATEPSQVAAFAQVSASGQVGASCSCRLLSHQTLLWHHRLGHLSVPRLRGMHSRLLVSGLPRSLPPLPPLPAPPCLPCVEGRQRAAPHSSSFPLTTAPLQTLHMDVWGPARVSGQSRERYFLLVIDDYSRYTTVFPLRSMGQDLPVLRLHSDRGGEFSSNLLRDFFRGEGILQTFTLPDSPQQNGIAERRIGLVMEVARTSMIHAAALHFLWPFAVQYATHQLILWPHVSLPKTSPTLHWTGKVGDASVFRVWGSRAFVRDMTADKLSPALSLASSLALSPDAPGWPFTTPPRAVSSLLRTSQPLPPQGPAPSGVSQVEPLPSPAPAQVAVDSGAAQGAASGGAASGGTYVDEVPPPGANIVDGMWIFRVKRPPGSPPAFKACYVARGFSQRQGVDYFQTFSPCPKMTTLRVLLHVAAQRDYELHSLDFSTAFLQGSLHEEIWLRRSPDLTESFPAGTQWSLRRPVYGLHQVPHEWHDTLRTTLAALMGLLMLLLTRRCFHARHLAADVLRPRLRRRPLLQRFGFHFSSPQPTPLSTSHSLSAPPSDKSVEPSGLYPELMGCLMYLMTCTRPDLAYLLSLLARYVAPGRHRKVHRDAAKRVLRYLCSMSDMGLVLGGRGPVVLTGHANASWVDDSATSSCEAEIYAGAMAAQELRWLTYLLTD